MHSKELRHFPERRYPRYVLSVPLDVTHRAMFQKVPGLTIEISEGGLSAMLTEALEIGELVTASFELPSVGGITIEGLARHKNLFRYGFEFVALNNETRRQILRAYEYLPPYSGHWY